MFRLLLFSSFLWFSLAVFAQNVGIGTTSPGAKLHVDQNGNEVLRLEGLYPFLSLYSGATKMAIMQSTLSEDFLFYNYGIGSIGFRNTGGMKMLIESGGNVGLSTSSPTQRLHISGSMRLEGGLYDRLNNPGTSGYVLKSTVTGVEWVDPVSVSGLQGATGPSGANGSTGATGPLVAGSLGQTLYHNGTDWTATSNLYNDSALIGVGTTSPTAMFHLEKPVSGPTLVYGNDFTSNAVGNVPDVSGTDPYENNMNILCVAEDGWRISATDANGTSCSGCSGNRAVIDYGAPDCDQLSTLFLGPFTVNVPKVYIRISYGYDDLDLIDRFSAVLWNETTNSQHLTLFSLTSDCNDCVYADYATGLSIGDQYSLRFLYEGYNGWGATVDNILVTYSTAELLQIVDGNEASGKVLTSDADGYASWQTVSGGGGGSGSDDDWVFGYSGTTSSDPIYRSGNVGIGQNVVASHTLDVDIGTETGTDIGVGSIEYILDGSAETQFSHRIVPINDNSITLGSSSKRWSTVYAANGFINTSDIRDKTNIKSLDYGISELMKLKPITYQWKNQRIGEFEIPENLIETKIGLSAQDLLEVLPEVVKTHDWIKKGEESEEYEYRKNERLGVTYSDLIPVTIKAIQEQQTIIEEQNKKIEKLEKAIKSRSKTENGLSDGGYFESNRTEIRVDFSKTFKKQFDPEKEPIITITPRSWHKRYMVKSIDKNGFILVVEHDSSVKTFKFNWKASNY